MGKHAGVRTTPLWPFIVGGIVGLVLGAASSVAADMDSVFWSIFLGTVGLLTTAAGCLVGANKWAAAASPSRSATYLKIDRALKDGVDRIDNRSGLSLLLTGFLTGYGFVSALTLIIVK